MKIIKVPITTIIIIVKLDILLGIICGVGMSGRSHWLVIEARGIY